MPSSSSRMRRARPPPFDKVYEQYKLAPEVTRRRMCYETMEEVLAKTDKTIVEAPGVVPYLPLSTAATPLAGGARDNPRASAGRRPMNGLCPQPGGDRHHR